MTVSNSNKRKNASNSNTSFRPTKHNKSKTAQPPTLTYLFNEKESTALDTVFTRLFERTTEANSSI